ncbi:MAG: BufA2 family periplasmic bufferin-type metallophore, partial [Burkholderiales bacterium]
GYTLNTVKKLSGVALAAAAATLFVAGCKTQDTVYAATGKVECTGVNSCKGLSDCKTARNACKGMNSCAGQGFVLKTPYECWKYQIWKKSFP